MDTLLDNLLTENQKELKKKHGLPSEFAVKCYQLVPGWISMEEAKAAVETYQNQWNEAAGLTEGEEPNQDGEQDAIMEER